ncbi:MAG: lysophospholipase [candidate division KSB1 bacterium]|nr:lysophospholipase [candidate division KSB1 bacterium]MDZ7333945.1 lysophospholipase [candidate division KSB1 bacterium]MDZ7358516.1 lysophospholipase [candidate division KSB1 bacterium]MDZ7377499.1 lysophospholipase [candidate division KSB1 bacterium]MDZ7399191.1 lysophospholipase [candidate division KSB1 bacterium]
MSQYAEGRLQSEDGLTLFTRSWRPDGVETKAVTMIVHGLAEHSGRYVHVGEFLAGRGIAVEGFDLRGHGQSSSPGSKTYVKRFDDYIADAHLMLQRLMQRYSGLPIFVLGHSMGGLIASLLVVSRQPAIRGLILSAPALKISDDISPVLIKLSAIIGKLLPNLPTIKLDSSAISRDPEVVHKYDTDPLNYRGGIRARTGAEINRATQLIQRQMEAIQLPLLILHGTADRLADITGSKQLYERAQSSDKELKLYEGFYHEVMNEPEKEKVLNDIASWIEKRC